MSLKCLVTLTISLKTRDKGKQRQINPLLYIRNIFINHVGNKYKERENFHVKYKLVMVYTHFDTSKEHRIVRKVHVYMTLILIM